MAADSPLAFDRSHLHDRIVVKMRLARTCASELFRPLTLIPSFIPLRWWYSIDDRSDCDSRGGCSASVALTRLFSWLPIGHRACEFNSIEPFKKKIERNSKERKSKHWGGKFKAYS